MNTKSGWLDYWDGNVSLYVSPRHLEAHYQGLFSDIEALLPPPPFTLMDYGCGEALMAPALADRGGSVILFDQAPSRRATLRQRFAGLSGVRVAESLEELDGTCDLILMISVIQYVPKPELSALLRRLRQILKPDGRLVIGDILSPGNHLVDDTVALLRFALEQGFLWDALAGLCRILGSTYREERRRLGLSCYAPDEITQVLAEAGYSSEPLGWNIGHARHRRSLVARPVAG
ncbi:SAM-dependent methyltransferase [Paramagnetospirillum marisnigri]|uniref:SAM-dependent methyltransferase n=1 Tax=Paramagnetospirillum marisnigri TaxID=1285242 RepID=A0A178MML3_9PROT|nr:class I SAM-dependent methyltransferase [Paramagnetospirillum marisnigri]OAN49921.1 SAM-dependent methyltransferase [Paramagnetospirillum marisnigri]